MTRRRTGNRKLQGQQKGLLLLSNMGRKGDVLSNTNNLCTTTTPAVLCASRLLSWAHASLLYEKQSSPQSLPSLFQSLSAHDSPPQGDLLLVVRPMLLDALVTYTASYTKLEANLCSHPLLAFLSMKVLIRAYVVWTAAFLQTPFLPLKRLEMGSFANFLSPVVAFWCSPLPPL